MIIKYAILLTRKESGEAMNTFLYLEINFVGLCILFIFLFNRHRNFNVSSEQKAFDLLIKALIIMLLLDSGMWLIDGTIFPYSFLLNQIITATYYFFNCAIPFLWFYYTALYFRCTSFFFHRFRYLTILPLILNTLCILINFNTQWMYSIDSLNTYHRGPLFFLPVLLAFSYLILSGILAWKKEKMMTTSEEKENCLLIFLFLALPILGGLVQAFIYGVSAIWICTVLSSVMIFVNVQNSQMSTDVLTGLNNRFQFNKTLSQKLALPIDKKDYTLIMIDLNRFKQINDTLGHVAGDRALVCTAEILKKSCACKDAFLCRFGGDEFTIVCSTPNVPVVLEHIEYFVYQFNNSKKEKFQLSLSIGTAHCIEQGINTMDDLIHRADQRMYKQKMSYNLNNPPYLSES